VLDAKPGSEAGKIAGVRPRTEDDSADRDRPLKCAACGHRITDEAYGIERGGGHAHSFVNPGGYVHHIRCFLIAPGCVHMGEPETEMTWFPGFTWQLAVCGSCRDHLGWLFRSKGDQFHGLIAAKLVE